MLQTQPRLTVGMIDSSRREALMSLFQTKTTLDSKKATIGLRRMGLLLLLSIVGRYKLLYLLRLLHTASHLQAHLAACRAWRDRLPRSDGEDLSSLQLPPPSSPDPDFSDPAVFDPAVFADPAAVFDPAFCRGLLLASAPAPVEAPALPGFEHAPNSTSPRCGDGRQQIDAL